MKTSALTQPAKIAYLVPGDIVQVTVDQYTRYRVGTSLDFAFDSAYPPMGEGPTSLLRQSRRDGNYAWMNPEAAVISNPPQPRPVIDHLVAPDQLVWVADFGPHYVVRHPWSRQFVLVAAEPAYRAKDVPQAVIERLGLEVK